MTENSAFLVVAIAGDKNIVGLAGAKFDVLVNHGLAQVDLKTRKAHVAPVIDLDDVKLSAVFKRQDAFGHLAGAGDIHLARRRAAPRRAQPPRGAANDRPAKTGWRERGGSSFARAAHGKRLVGTLHVVDVSPALQLFMGVRGVGKVVMARVGLSSLKALQPKAPFVRYGRKVPGDLLHMDTKKLARIKRPSHRVTGNRRDTVVGAGWEVAHVAIDKHSRVGFVQMHADETKETAAAFLKAAVAHYKALGMRIKRLITDNGSPYRSRLFARTCKDLGIKHTFTRPYRPQTNGKAERFIQTCLREWTYGRVWVKPSAPLGCQLSCTTTTPAVYISLWTINHQLPDFVGTTYCNSTVVNVILD